ncbi:hypothetical protein V2J09_015152 [Rumex salicifolius]
MAEIDKENPLTSKIATILEETKGSNATHNRKLKELSNLRSSSLGDFFPSFCKALAPFFAFQRRTATAERVVRFVASFAGFRDPKTSQISQEFLEDFLRFLLSGTSAADKTARSQACHIISETILRLPDDVEVNDDLLDEVIEVMKIRVADKVPIIRVFAVRALSRFVNDSDNIDILELLLDALTSEQNADIRKTLVLSFPPSNATSAAIIDCTLDVSESVRKAAYFVLANKFPIQSLSIKLRTVILQRGLSDRSPAVVKECMKLLKDEWLLKCCNNDPVELLKFLDVETYETVGNSVLESLLRARMVEFHDDKRIQELGGLNSEESTETSNPSTPLLEPEVALYWRAVCWYIQTEAEAKGSEAASAMGAEAAVYAAEASDNHDLLEKVLPATISHYVEYVKLHLAAGPNYRFVARQLLLLGGMLDYSDATNWRVASTFVHDLLHRNLDYEVDDTGNKIVIGDGINLGGDKDWACAVSTLAKKVHSAAGEFEEILLRVIEELAKPCRERTADFMQWMHCLAVTGLLLENTKSFHHLQGKAIEPVELLQSLLLPGARHLNLYVKRIAIRCIGLYGLLERKPNEELVKQLRVSFANGPSPICALAGKALIDNVMWHGLEEIDRAHGLDFPSQEQQCGNQFAPGDNSDASADINTGVLRLLYAGFEREEAEEAGDDHDNESLKAVLGEGFAKMLLLSENYPSMPAGLHSLFLSKLIHLYFINENIELQRLKQCLSKIISNSFIPVLRGMWPGVDGNPGGSSTMISNMRKRAVQVSRFIVQMMQAPLYAKEAQSSSRNLPESDSGTSDDYDSGEEGLAIRIAAEVLTFNVKKTPAEKAYLSALCKALALLHFRPSEQGAVKLTRLLLNRVAISVSHDKEVVKDLQRMATRLKALDTDPDQELSPDLANLIFERLDLENPGIDNFEDVVQPTPAPRSTRPTQSRRRVRREEASSDEESSPTSVVPMVPPPSSVRSQRASKTAALTKLTAQKSATRAVIEEEEDLELSSEEENSDVTSEDEFDG